MIEKIKKHQTKLVVLLCMVFTGIVSASATTVLSSGDVTYDNTNSGLTASNMQDAIDELYTVAQLSERLDKVEDELKTKIDIDDAYPVGSIYISIVDDTAAKVKNRFGGTWASFGSGKTIIGVNTSDSSFNTVEKTGGNKTHSIGVGNLPAHNHSIPGLSGSTAAANNVGQARSAGSHTHSTEIYLADYSGTKSYVHSGMWSNQGHPVITMQTQSAGEHTHTLNIPSLSVSTNASNTNGCTNCSGTALNTQDPYITVYMWKRTA